MAKLSELQMEIEAGKTVTANDGDGYKAAYKRGDLYIAVEDVDRRKFATFEELCEYLEPDEEAFTSDECTWEVEIPLTPEEMDYYKGWLLAVMQGDLNSASRQMVVRAEEKVKSALALDHDPHSVVAHKLLLRQVALRYANLAADAFEHFWKGE